MDTMLEYLDSKSRDRLKAYCKVGKLFDAQRLLEERGTCRLRKTRKWSPLRMAVSKGFHSLVQVLLRYDHAQWDLKKCHEHALRHGRGDLATMILACPHWTDPIDPVVALASGEPALVRRLIGQGLELQEGDHVCRAAIRNPRGVLRVISDLGLTVESFEEQLHSAMVTLVNSKNTRSAWVLLRAGLDARKPAPYYDERERLWEPESVMSLAVHTGNHRFLQSLRPDPAKDDEVALIRSAGFMGDEKVLEVLLNAGFRLSCKANGGSPVVDQVLAGQALGCVATCEVSGSIRTTWGYKDSQKDQLINRLKAYLEMGAKWVPDPDDGYHLRCVRDTLLVLGGHWAGRVVELLREYGAAEQDILLLFKTERMRELASELGIGRKRRRRSARSRGV